MTRADQVKHSKERIRNIYSLSQNITCKNATVIKNAMNNSNLL